MLIELLWLGAGAVLLYFGATWLIDGSSSLAVGWGMKPITVGITVVAIGTSSPELSVALSSVLSGSEGVAVGNLVGANILNLSLVLAFAALLRPFTIGTEVVRMESLALIGTCLLAGWFLLDGGVTRVEGSVLAGLFLVHMGIALWSARRESWSMARHEFTKQITPSGNLPADLGKVAAGLALLIFGSRLMVSSAVDIAGMLGISEAVIALTVISLGTTLPEMTSGAVAALRGEGDLILGAVFGSCIFNMLAILGLSAAIRPMQTPGLAVSVYLMAGLALLMLPFFRPDFRLGRREGGFLLVVYLGYVVYLFASVS